MSHQLPYSPSQPCRCGFDGNGTHRCHAGRPDPNGTGEDGSRHCPHQAIDQLHYQLAILPGMQMKGISYASHYCEEHHRQLYGE